MHASDIQQISKIIKNSIKDLPTKKELQRTLNRELSKYATKKDLQDGLDELLTDIVDAVDKSKADKSDVIVLEKRVTKVEDQLAA